MFKSKLISFRTHIWTKGKKQAGSAGRFGVRYSARIRQKVSAIEAKAKAKYECPSCNRKAVKRKFKGIWECSKCQHTFAGKAFSVGE